MPGLSFGPSIVVWDLELAVKVLVYHDIDELSSEVQARLRDGVLGLTVYTLAELLRRGKRYFSADSYVYYQSYVLEQTTRVNLEHQDALSWYAELAARADGYGLSPSPDEVWNAVANRIHQFPIATSTPERYLHLCSGEDLIA